MDVGVLYEYCGCMGMCDCRSIIVYVDGNVCM